MEMIYKKFRGLQLSSLGRGCMRLPVVGENEEAATKKERNTLLCLGAEIASPKVLACIGCRSCGAVCPQQLKILEAMPISAPFYKEGLL